MKHGGYESVNESLDLDVTLNEKCCPPDQVFEQANLTGKEFPLGTDLSFFPLTLVAIIRELSFTIILVVKLSLKLCEPCAAMPHGLPRH